MTEIADYGSALGQNWFTVVLTGYGVVDGGVHYGIPEKRHDRICADSFLRSLLPVSDVVVLFLLSFGLLCDMLGFLSLGQCVDVDLLDRLLK